MLSLLIRFESSLILFEFCFFFTLALAPKTRERVKRAQENTSMAMTSL